jgi:hypothetical protein
MFSYHKSNCYCINDCKCYNNSVKQSVKKSIDNTTVITNDKFKIVIVLDESGSMESIKNNMLKSLNILITEQKEIKGRPSTFTLVKFNDKINRKIENMPLEEIRLLTTEDYTPQGSTALYDAIGTTINRFRNEHDVMLVIITDGQENASTTYNKEYVTQKLDEKKKYNNWSYVYLSCDIATFEQGSGMGLKNSSYSTNAQMSVDSYGKYISTNLNHAISNFRKNGVSVQSQLNS